MDKNTIDKMKKLIDEKKKKSSQQGLKTGAPNKMGGGSSRAFKSTKRGGSITK